MPANLREIWTDISIPFGGIDTQSIFFQFYHHGEVVVRQKIHHTELVTLMAKGEFSIFRDEIQDVCVFRQGEKDVRTFHAFVVFSTEKYFFSIERYYKYISIQCSTSIADVVRLHNGKPRDYHYLETEVAQGQGSVWDLIRILLQKKIFQRKYHHFKRNCQIFAALVYKNTNSEGKTFKKYRIVQ